MASTPEVTTFQSYENAGFSRGSSVSSKKAIISPEDFELNDESFLSDLERDSAHSSVHERSQEYEKKYMELQRQSQRRPTSLPKQPQDKVGNKQQHVRPRYPILDTSQIQIRLEEENERRKYIENREERRRRPPIQNDRPEAKLSNLFGVIDPSKLRGLCGSYDTHQPDQNLGYGLEPIPEASAPPIEEELNLELSKQTANKSASREINCDNNPYQTHGKWLLCSI